MSEHEIIKGTPIIEEPEMDPAAEAVANEIGPQIVGQNQLVGHQLVYMKSSQGTHTMLFDNGIEATFIGSIKLRQTHEVKGEGDPQELTGRSVFEHFKSLEQGEGQE